MKYIDKLLQGAEVEWTTLGDTRFIEIANNNRKPVKSSNRTIGNIPYYGANNIQDYVNGYTHNGTYILVAEDGTASVENYSIQWAVGKFWANNHVHVLRGVGFIESRFIFHYLRTVNFIPFLTGGERAKLTKRKLQEIPIPILCPNNPTKSLEIQRKLVEILDKFTELEAELEAELDCRKRQYEYYRNKLLTFDMLNTPPEKLNSINWLTIKDISKNISSGGTPRSNNATYYGGDIPWLRTQEVNFSDIWDTEVKITKEGMDASSAKYIPANCVIIAMYGATVGRVGINKIPLTTNQACANIEVDENIALYRYVFHYLSSQYEYIRSLGAGSQTNINARIVKGLKIPIPPLSEQQRIVSILDKFETLTSSISEGLPKEIELRRKQYEYYREQLLSFRH